MNSIILGIDISKETFDVALLINNKVKNKKFNNNLQGFYGVSEWLKTKQVYTAHACMEATNTYGLKLAEYLYTHIKTTGLAPWM